MLTWGLLRTNFSLDIAAVPLGAGSGHQIFTNLQRDFLVVIEFHRVSGSAFGPRAKVGGVPEHRRHRDKTGDGLYTTAHGYSSHFSTSGMQIAEDVSDGFIGGYDLERHDRLEERRTGLIGRIDQRLAAG